MFPQCPGRRCFWNSRHYILRGQKAPSSPWIKGTTVPLPPESPNWATWICASYWASRKPKRPVSLFAAQEQVFDSAAASATIPNLLLADPPSSVLFLLPTSCPLSHSPHFSPTAESLTTNWQWNCPAFLQPAFSVLMPCAGVPYGTFYEGGSKVRSWAVSSKGWLAADNNLLECFLFYLWND